MRKIISFVLVLTLLQSFQCENDNQNDVITEEMLNNKRTEITNYIGQFTCSATSSCNFIPLGSKPCGGPREYLVYSENVNQNELEQLVSEYYTMDSIRNIQTNAISDCSVVMPPENIDCVNGVCTIMN